MKKIIIFIILAFVCTGCKNTASIDETSIQTVNYDGYTLLWGLKNNLIKSGISTDGKAYYTIQNRTDRLDFDQVITYMLTIPVRYAVEVNLTMKSKRMKDSVTEIVHMEREMEDFFVSIYSLRNGNVLRTFDMANILKEKGMSIMPTDYTMFATRMYEGRACLVFGAEDIVPSFEDKNNNTKRIIYLDVDTGEVFESEYEDIKDELEDENRVDSIFNAKFGKFIKQNRTDKFLYSEYDRTAVRTLNFWEGCRQIHFADMEDLPPENAKLFSLFPELKEEYKRSSLESVDIVLTGNPSEEEIMSLMIPDGQEISFEGIKMSAENSIDGMEHDIHSFDEWREYFRPSENAGKYTSPVLE